MEVTLISPGLLMAGALNDGGIQHTHFSTTAAARDARGDVLILDLGFWQIGTSEPTVNEAEIAAVVLPIAEMDPDRWWILISPQGLEAPAYRLRDKLARVLNSDADRIAVVTEAFSTARVAEVLRPRELELAQLGAISLTVDEPLTSDEERCVRRVLRDVSGASLRRLGGGGLSKTYFVECEVEGGQGPPRILKVGPAADARREHEGYIRYVSRLAGGGRFPFHDSREDLWYAGDRGVIVYSQVGGAPSQTLTGVLRSGPAADVIDDLVSTVLGPWLTMRRPTRMSLSALVDLFLQTDLAAVAKVWGETEQPSDSLWSPVEWLIDVCSRPIEVELYSAITHGDLHGHNVIVDASRNAWLIDFSSADRRPAAFDLAFADSSWFAHNPEGPGSCAIPMTPEELADHERHYHEHHGCGRPECGRMRSEGRAAGEPLDQGHFELLRSAAALRWLCIASANHGHAKVIASQAAAAARAHHPEWERVPPVPDIPL
jgi:hypothetical protein